MFGLGMGEIVLIAIVALLFLGPDKLPTAAKSIGRTIRGLRRQTRELSHSLEQDNEIGDAVREIRSALRDEPPPRPRPSPTMPAADANADANGDGDGDGDGDDDIELEPEPHFESGVSEFAESGLPHIGPAPGAVARGGDGDDDEEEGVPEPKSEEDDGGKPPRTEHG